MGGRVSTLIQLKKLIRIVCLFIKPFVLSRLISSLLRIGDLKMLQGNRCELCNKVIKSTKAQYKQTKYCQQCAKQKKRENTENSWLPEKKREYMRGYMREYRRLHPKLSNKYVLKHRQKKLETLTENNYRAKSSVVPASQNQDMMFFSFAGFLLFLSLNTMLSSETISGWFNFLETTIKYLELAVIKISGLGIIILVCYQHIKRILKNEKKKNNDDKDIIG